VSDTIEIDLYRAMELVGEAVNSMGRDFVYNPGGGGVCQYSPRLVENIPQAKTGCIVGTALKLAGWDSERIGKLYGSVPVADGEVVLWEGVTHAARKYFKVAQVVQDNGGTWGVR
jgi:hypothetical protein